MCVANDAAEETSALDHPVSLFSVIAYATCPIALLAWEPMEEVAGTIVRHTASLEYLSS